jgi:RimK family alpha-L-glutamate ligase
MRILWLGWDEMHSTRRMCEVAKKMGLSFDALEIFDVSFHSEDRRAGIFHKDTDLVAAYDVLIVRTFYPYISEALTIARLFRDAGKLVIDESLTDEGYAVSKMHDNILLAQHGLPVPLTRQVFDQVGVEAFASEVGYPCVLKGIHGAHGSAVFLANDVDQLHHWLWRFPYGELVAQEFLPAEEDYRLLTIGGETLPHVISRHPDPGDFRTNFALDADFTACPAQDFPELVALAEQASRLLRREFAGVDIRYKKGQPMILEVNRRPAFEGYEKATGYDVAGKFLAYIQARYLARR